MDNLLRTIQEPLQRMEGRLNSVDERAGRISDRMECEHRHVVTTLATQRENVATALEQVQVAMLEQEMSLRSHLQASMESVDDLRDLLSNVKSSVEDVQVVIQGLADVAGDHEERIKRLEQKPPAA